MTKYCVDVHNDQGWTSIALFSDSVSLESMITFAQEQFSNGNSLTTPGDDIAVIDMTTGEILWNWLDDTNDLTAMEELFNTFDYSSQTI